LHDVRPPTLETDSIQQGKEADMSLINDYTHQTLTDARERDFARLAEHDRLVRLALNGRVGWWRRLLARRGRQDRAHDSTVKVQQPAHRTV
jgi:hypothetical protein